MDFDLLHHSEIFSGTSAEVVKLFAYLATHRICRPGEEIIVRGQGADRCYLVIRGEVDLLTLHQGKEVVVQRLRVNGIFGELALLSRFNWFFSARARGEAELLVISRESFQKVLDKYPEKRDRLTEKVIQLSIARFESQTGCLLDRLLEAGLPATACGPPLID